jgi:hypothetical protein
MPKKRKCRYCGKTPPGKFQVCLSVKCQAKKKEARLTRMRLSAKAQREMIRAESLKKKPRFCDHCGAAMTSKDNLKFPICQRLECRDWWVEEKAVREKLRNADWRARTKETKETKRRVVAFQIRPTDFSQRKYEAEQESAKNSGRKCLTCGKLTNGVNYYCDEHHRLINAKAAGGNFEGPWAGGGDSARRTFQGVV